MNIWEQIGSGPRRTPVRLWLWQREELAFPDCRVFHGGENCRVIFGDWRNIAPVLEENRNKIQDFVLDCDRRNSALPLLEIQTFPARIEPGAILRAGAEIGENAVIMMGAVVNIGAKIGPGTMVDMNAVIGGRAQIGAGCHIGAGAVVAGVIEPPSAIPVVIEDGVTVGANAVILEGCRVGARAVVAAGAVVTRDVPENAVAVGCPARIVKLRDAQTDEKTAIVEALRQLP